MSQPDLQTIVIHIPSNISRSKSNQTMKFGQFIEYNMRNIFLDKSYTHCPGEAIPRPFSEKSKLIISLDRLSKCSTRLNFILSQVDGYRKLLKLSCRPLTFTSNKALLKKQEEVWS